MGWKSIVVEFEAEIATGLLLAKKSRYSRKSQGSAIYPTAYQGENLIITVV